MAVTLDLDLEGRILAVGGDWTAFAEANGGASTCQPHQVVGRPLAGFIDGEAARRWLERVVLAALRRGLPLERTFRCDSPTEKRHMRMRISPGPGGLHFEYELDRVQPMARPAPWVTAGSGPAVLRCSICNRLEQSGRWFEPDALPRPLAFQGPAAVHHGVCPFCETSALALPR